MECSYILLLSVYRGRFRNFMRQMFLLCMCDTWSTIRASTGHQTLAEVHAQLFQIFYAVSGVRFLTKRQRKKMKRQPRRMTEVVVLFFPLFSFFLFLNFFYGLNILIFPPPTISVELENFGFLYIFFIKYLFYLIVPILNFTLIMLKINYEKKLNV